MVLVGSGSKFGIHHSQLRWMWHFTCLSVAVFDFLPLSKVSAILNKHVYLYVLCVCIVQTYVYVSTCLYGVDNVYFLSDIPENRSLKIRCSSSILTCALL